jgi:polygalacturonase/PKD repeat protein
VLASVGLASAAPALPVISNQTFVVTNAIYGAVGDGVTDNTLAIQSAINDAGTNGGGTVLIPAGTYLSGPLTLTNHINLQIAGGATLKALPLATFTNYPAQNLTFPDLIYAKNVTDIEISGSGTIDGQGAAWWTAPGSVSGDRPYMIFFNGGCQRVWIRGVTLQNPMKMHIVFKGVDSDITIDGITINTTNDLAANTDGIDLVGTHCLIQNSIINSGDDNIAIGSSSASAVSTDILITNCTFGVGHGVSIGSNTAGGVSNMTVVACTFDGTDYGIRMKSDNKTSGGSGQGGVAQNLTYSDIRMTNIIFGAIVLYSYYSEVGTPTSISPSTAAAQTVGAVLFPVWRNITFSNVSAVVTGRIAGIIWGRREVPFTNVVLQSVNITAPSTFDIYNARGIQIIDSQITVPGTTNMFNFYDAEVSVTNSAFNTNLERVGGLAIPPTNCVLGFFNANAMVAETNLLGTGSITLQGGTLKFRQLLANSSSNTLNILGASTLSFTNGTNLFSGKLNGPGPLTLDLPPNTLLTPHADVSGFTGSFIISNSGTLLVNPGVGGTGTNPVIVLSGATLGGNGVIGGPVTVNGTLAPGSSPGTLTISNNLAVNAGAALQYELGTNSDLTAVSGNLSLDGTLNIADAGGFITNTYTLFTYVGTLTDNGLTVGTTPDASLAYTFDTNTPGLVKLVVAIPPPVAGFIASATAGIAPLTVTFTDTSTGLISNRHWDFGDGATSNVLATSVVHIYNAGGSNTVQLIVNGPGGASTNSTVIIVAPSCSFPLSATNANFSVTGGSNTVTVSPYTNVCTWTAVSNDAWIQIAGGSVSTTGVAVVAYTVLPNASSASPRVGTMTIAGQTFTVTEAGDTTPPTVVLTAPSSGVVSNTIAVSATAFDNIAVARVEFFRDSGILIGTITTPPYSLNFNTATVGESSLCFFARAFDGAGNSSTSSTNCVTVDNHALLAAMLGEYNGLVIQTNAPSHASSGSIIFKVSNTGSFAAKLAIGGGHLSFKGQFDASGNATNILARKGLNPLQAILRLDLGGSEQITGTVSDGSFTSELIADRTVFDGTNPCPFAGNFDIVLDPPNGDDPSIPQGFGYGTLNVTTTGRGRLRGVLGDGTKISTTAPVSRHGMWPLYKVLYKNQGASVGWATFGSNTTLGATVDWFRPSLPSSQFYPAGFATNVTLIGKRYIPPDSNTSAAGNYQVSLGGGNLQSDIVKSVYLYDVGNVVVLSANAENLKMKIDPATGQFSGSFTHPLLNETIKFTGSLLQFGSTGAGYFLGATEGGFVIFVPAP